MSNLRILLDKKIKETDILSLEINEKKNYKGVFIGSTASEVVLLQDNLEPVYLHYEDVTDFEVLGSNGLELFKKKELVKDNENKTFLENLTGKGEKLIHAFFKEVKKIDDRFELKEAKESIIFKNAEGKSIFSFSSYKGELKITYRKKTYEDYVPVFSINSASFYELGKKVVEELDYGNI